VHGYLTGVALTALQPVLQPNVIHEVRQEKHIEKAGADDNRVQETTVERNYENLLKSAS